MMFVMTSKEFRDIFLQKTKDQDILRSQYVLVSYRIKQRGKRKNIIDAANILWPSSAVCLANDQCEFEMMYKEQLERDAIPFLATLVKASVEDGFTIIFLCTKKESKIGHFMKLLSNFVLDEFKYPVYDYKEYMKHPMPIPYSYEEVLTTCDEIMIQASEKYYMKEVSTYSGIGRILDNLKDMTKTELQYRLEVNGIDTEGFSKKEMISLVEEILMSNMKNGE